MLSTTLLKQHLYLIGAWFIEDQRTSTITTHEKKKENQRRAIQREFEPVGLTLLRNPLCTWCGLLPTLRVGGLLMTHDVQKILHYVFRFY